jgi:hypothetical protein
MSLARSADGAYIRAVERTPDFLYSEAVRRLDVGDVDAALSLAMRALRGTTDERLVAPIVGLLSCVDEPERVRPLARKAAARFPTAPVVEALAEVELRAGMVREARSSFNRAASLAGRETDLHQRLLARAHALDTCGRLVVVAPASPQREVMIPPLGAVIVPLIRDVVLPSAIVAACDDDAADAGPLTTVHELAASGDVEGAYALAVEVAESAAADVARRWRHNAAAHASLLAFAVGDDAAACEYGRQLRLSDSHSEVLAIAFAAGGLRQEALDHASEPLVTSRCRGTVHFLVGAFGEAFRDLSYAAEGKLPSDRLTLLGWAGVAQGEAAAARVAFQRALATCRKLAPGARRAVESSAKAGLRHCP